jgi:hypothetical protein
MDFEILRNKVKKNDYGGSRCKTIFPFLAEHVMGSLHDAAVLTQRSTRTGPVIANVSHLKVNVINYTSHWT